MLTRPQIILLKRAQAQSHVDDAEYRDTLEQLCGVRSSKDPKLTDAQLDQLLSYFEALFWRAVDQGTLKESCNPNAVFQKRNFWAAKNQKHNTSRDRFAAASILDEISKLEEHLLDCGVGLRYLVAIQRKTGNAAFSYRAALKRTLAARAKNAGVPADRRPF